jgi:hypothetical protein
VPEGPELAVAAEHQEREEDRPPGIHELRQQAREEDPDLRVGGSLRKPWRNPPPTPIVRGDFICGVAALTFA